MVNPAENSKESVNDQPNYFLRNLDRNKIDQITFFEHLTTDLMDLTKEFITYKRSDGVNLTTTVYLPSGYNKESDGRLPVLAWAYPCEFKSAVAG